MNTLHTIAFHTLGCKLNFSETSSLATQLEKEGFIKRNFDEVADVYVINTCSVTENADKECRYLVRKIQKLHPAGFIVIVGCYAQLKPQEIAAIQGVDLVLGAAEKFNLSSYLKDLVKGGAPTVMNGSISDVSGFFPAFSGSDRTRTFLKIQDGCDYNCSFCTIPLARGKSRSNTIEGVLKQCNELAEKGVKEVILTGVNLGDFGKGNQGGKHHHESFYELLQQLVKINGIERYRISSIEPNLLTDEIIELVSSGSKIMPHFHIPLQSGSNAILKKMRRRYQRELYYEKIMQILEKIPFCGIGVDVIVGFPGEGESEFKETFDFIHGMDVSYLHVFTYSERDDTDAIKYEPVVPQQIRNERNKILRNLGYMKQQYFKQKQSGMTRPVLFEKHQDGNKMEGYTDNYIRVEMPYNVEKVNTIVDVMV